MNKKTIAKIKTNAGALFWYDICKRLGKCSSPASCQTTFYFLLLKLEGKTFEIEKKYGDRIVLKYPKKMIKDNIVGVDLNIKLVDEVNENIYGDSC